jgi:hypothetical protein
MEGQTLKRTDMSEIKKDISDTLRNMTVGTTEEFPIERLSSVRQTIFRLQKSERLSFSTSTDENSIFVTRK